MSRSSANPHNDPQCFVDDPLREEAEFFAEAEMERLFAGDDMDEATAVLDAGVPDWYAQCQARITEAKYAALCSEARENAMSDY